MGKQLCWGYKLKIFFLFLIYMLLYILTLLSIHLIRIGEYCMNSQRKIISILITITIKKCQIFEILLLSFFLIFVSQLIQDQITSIKDNQTIIQQRQDKFVFDDEKWYHCILPIKPKLKQNYIELVFDEELIKQGTQYLKDIIYDETNPGSIHFIEFILDNYSKQKQ
ncbi:unnamed protein product [Paramecium sonneborni]|uniref:Transmembrane protein n=1 Tax=Paramecium sonneborni TaxID=65129 RepID=A0A8S1M7Z1_9CILI|nr:unnamed protein product [Paramecium sonneborni]